MWGIEGDRGITNSGTLVISGGEIETGNVAIENKGTLTLGVKDGEMTCGHGMAIFKSFI